MTDVTEIKFPNKGSDLLPEWKIKNFNKIDGAYIGNFLKSTKTSSPTGHSVATTIPPIRDIFMYIETSSNNHGANVFVSFERIDIIQISKITFFITDF